MRAGRELRADMVAFSRLLADRGWVANHDGNLTARLAADRFLATPTATAKRLVEDRWLIEVDRDGKRVSGTQRPFGELGLHMAVYERRDDVRAVIHAHPPHATAIACSPGNPIERPFIAEAVVSIGARIPKVPFAMPGDDAGRALAAVVQDVDAALLANHGVIAWGADLEQAYLRLELVEHLARVAVLAQAVGGITPLPDSVFGPLLAKRARAGLGKAAEKAASGHAGPRAAPAPADAASQGSHGPVTGLAQVVREELMRALREQG